MQERAHGMVQYMLMRDEKEGRSKVKQTTIKVKQRSTFTCTLQSKCTHPK